MDPRNFLDEVNIFQFLDQSYNASLHTKEGLQSMLKGTFMEGNVKTGGFASGNSSSGGSSSGSSSSGSSGVVTAGPGVSGNKSSGSTSSTPGNSVLELPLWHQEQQLWSYFFKRQAEVQVLHRQYQPEPVLPTEGIRFAWRARVHPSAEKIQSCWHPAS